MQAISQRSDNIQQEHGGKELRNINTIFFVVDIVVCLCSVGFL